MVRAMNNSSPGVRKPYGGVQIGCRMDFANLTKKTRDGNRFAAHEREERILNDFRWLRYAYVIVITINAL